MRISDWSSDVCSSDLKVATTAKAFHRWGKSFDCQRGQWANPGNGLQAPRCVSLSRENLDLRGSGVDAKRLLGDLLQQVAAFHTHYIGQLVLRRLQDFGNLRDLLAPLRTNAAVFLTTVSVE